MNKVQNLHALALALGNVTRQLNVKTAQGVNSDSMKDMVEIENALIDMVTTQALELIPQVTQ